MKTRESAVAVGYGLPSLHGAPPGGRSPETMLEVDSIAWSLRLSKTTRPWRLATKLIVTLASKEATQHPMPFAKRWVVVWWFVGTGGSKKVKVGKKSSAKKASQAKNGYPRCVMTTTVFVS